MLFIKARNLFSLLKNRVEGTLSALTVNGVTARSIVKQIQVDQASRSVVLQLDLTQDYRKAKALLQQSLSYVEQLQIKLAAKQQKMTTAKGNLKDIKHILAVYSCKGGVGKSTVAVNLAYKLSRMGRSVGIFDADLFGPSLPTLIGREKQVLQPKQPGSQEILPVEHQNVKTMSMGYTGQKKAVLRGPMVSSLLSQLLTMTVWGSLDYLVVDMPPGTSDVQLTLCQDAKIQGAVVVTTPQKLAHIDTVKGIEMFQELNVPVLAIVQNMAYHVCQNCSHESKVFGPGFLKALTDQYGVPGAFQLPLKGLLSAMGDAGTPATLLKESTLQNKVFGALATRIQQEIVRPRQQTVINYEAGPNLIVARQTAKVKKIQPRTLRLMCKCAACVSQFTGQKLLKEAEVSQGVHPVALKSKGNYAVGIEWSDGHRSSIYPFTRLFSDEIPSQQ